MSTGLILSGGGARGAYQVGVLKALAELLPKDICNPFPVICGTSAGSINALVLAGRPGHFRLRVRKMEAIWGEMSADKIYRTDYWGVIKNSLNMMLSFLHSGYAVGKPKALLDNTPLCELLTRVIRFKHLDEAIASGELHAVCVTAMSYSTGQSVSFFQGKPELKSWARFRRYGIRCGITIEHLMASSAIPTLFPSQQIGDAFYGDGAVRHLKPLSPALHLGADRVFVIGVSDNPRHKMHQHIIRHSPSIAQIVGHMFNTAFIDSIESDLETLGKINQLTRALSTEERKDKGIQMRPIDFLAISPSEPIDELASEYIHELPRSIKMFLKFTGATAHGGGISAASYLLFSKGFCRKLLDMGYRDGLAQAAEIRRFFGLDSPDVAPSAINTSCVLPQSAPTNVISGDTGQSLA